MESTPEEARSPEPSSLITPLPGASHGIPTDRRRNWSRITVFLTLLGVAFGLPLGFGSQLGMDPPAARALAMLMVALLLWAGSGLPAGLGSVLILLALPVLGVLDFDTSVGSLGQPFVWLLVATFILARAVDQAQLGRRIALGLLRLTRGSSGYSLLAVLVAPLVLCFILPTSSGRTALLAPICDGMVRVMRSGTGDATPDRRRRGNLARAMFLGLAFVSVLAGVAVMTGSSAAVYASGIFPELTGRHWDYLHWTLVFYPLAVLSALLLWVGLLLIFRPEFRALPGGERYIDEAWRKLGPPRPSEWRTLAWVGLIVMGWLTAPYHSLSVPMVALAGSVGLTLPRLGVLDWSEVRTNIDWDVAIQFAAGFSLAVGMQQSGAATWLAGAASGLLEQPAPLAAALLLLGLMALMRLAFVSMVAIMATMLPVSVHLAEMWGIDAAWLSLFTIVGVSFSFFLLSQAPSNGITYAYGHYSATDLMLAGSMALVAVVLAALVLSVTLWPMLGFRP